MMKRNKQRKKGNKIIILFTIIMVCLAFYVIDKKLENGNTKFISILGKSNLKAEDAIVDLNEDKQIKYVSIVNRSTGTAPWDINDEPGNDNNASNDIVRSFDQVTWTINCGWGNLNETSTKTYNKGTIYVKAVLPDSIKNYVEWDVNSMGWAKNAKVENGVFTASYELPNNKCNSSGNQDLYLILKVLCAPNGLPINPTFYAGLKENTEEASVSLDENASADTVNSIVKVSAAPKLNVGIFRNGNNYKSYFDWKNGIESETKTANEEEQIYFGRMQGYGMVIQLYNPDFIDNTGATVAGKEKGLKGIAVPTGDITFDLSFTEQRTNSNGEILTGPIIWDYLENANRSTAVNGKLNRNLFWNIRRHYVF